MKKLICGLLIVFSITTIYANEFYDEGVSDTVIRTLLVTKIDKTKQAYFIHVQDTVCYTIVSLRTKDKSKDCIRLETGKEYQFSVTHYFESDMIPRPELKLEVYIDGVKLYVPMSGMNVFLTPNLKGLCYSKPE